MTFDFKPDSEGEEMVVPFYEDANNADGVIGYSTQRSQKELRSMITVAFGRLGAIVTSFQSGKFGNRYGFRIHFVYNGSEGRIDVCALPIQNETDSKIDRAKRHALYSVWKRLVHQYNTLLVMPGDVPLVPYMLNSEGQTMLEYIREMGQIPSLPDPQSRVVDGEFTENE